MAMLRPLMPSGLVIFGASGDLTARKLMPALYHLAKDGQMPADFRIVGFARREKELRQPSGHRNLPANQRRFQALWLGR